MKNIIPALAIGRKGSQGFPGKNTHPVLGHPLAHYLFQTTQNTKEINKIYISTNDPDLMKLAKNHNVEIMIRPEHLCTNKALCEDAFVHGYEEIRKKNHGCNIELIVLLFCNAPLFTSKMISEGIRVLRDNPELDSAVSVSKYNMWSPLRARKIDQNGLLQPFVPFETFGDPRTLNCDRDSQGDVWFADMGLSIVRPRCLENIKEGLLPQRWMGQKIYPLKNEAGLDVDYEWQLPQVEYWLKKNL